MHPARWGNEGTDHFPGERHHVDSPGAAAEFAVGARFLVILSVGTDLEQLIFFSLFFLFVRLENCTLEQKKQADTSKFSMTFLRNNSMALCYNSRVRWKKSNSSPPLPVAIFRGGGTFM